MMNLRDTIHAPRLFSGEVAGAMPSVGREVVYHDEQQVATTGSGGRKTKKTRGSIAGRISDGVGNSAEVKKKGGRRSGITSTSERQDTEHDDTEASTVSGVVTKRKRLGARKKKVVTFELETSPLRTKEEANNINSDGGQYQDEYDEQPESQDTADSKTVLATARLRNYTAENVRARHGIVKLVAERRCGSMMMMDFESPFKSMNDGQIRLEARDGIRVDACELEQEMYSGSRLLSSSPDSQDGDLRGADKVCHNHT